MDPNHAVEDKEDKETKMFDVTTVAPPVKQRAAESAPATTPSQPTLPQTFLQKLEAAYGVALRHNDGTQLDGSITDGKLW